MGKSLFVRVALVAIAGASLASTPVSGQTTSSQARTQSSAKGWTPGRTPWGDPDLQGVWTSDSENGVPFERPDKFAGKATVEGEELDQLLDQRAAQRSQNAPLAGGITGAGPTVDDPHTFARPWTAALNLTPQSELFEYACHEGNYGLHNILTAGRADDKAAAEGGRAPNRADTRGEER